ncbi:MAG TPA: hypothetical protein V6C52_05195 [Coleofasciculaceae cyanobacterium]|jgi:hypothetical protein
MRRNIQIALDEDTAEFLDLCQTDDSAHAISTFINSLLRQERFRQGYPAGGVVDISSQPKRNAIEEAMLRRSGLLPLPRRPRRR